LEWRGNSTWLIYTKRNPSPGSSRECCKWRRWDMRRHVPYIPALLTTWSGSDMPAGCVVPQCVLCGQRSRTSMLEHALPCTPRPSRSLVDWVYTRRHLSASSTMTNLVRLSVVQLQQAVRADQTRAVLTFYWTQINVRISSRPLNCFSSSPSLLPSNHLPLFPLLSLFHRDGPSENSWLPMEERCLLCLLYRVKLRAAEINFSAFWATKIDTFVCK